MRDFEAPLAFEKEEAKPWQAWHAAILRGVVRRKVSTVFPGLARPLRGKEYRAFLNFIGHAIQNTVADATGGALWHAAFQALPAPRSPDETTALWRDAFDHDAQAVSALAGALETPWAPQAWPDDRPLDPSSAESYRWAYQVINRFQRQALVLGWGTGEPAPEGLLRPWARALNGMDERLRTIPVEHSRWRLMARQAWWAMAAGFPPADVWHQGGLTTPDLGQPQRDGGNGLRHVKTLDTPVLNPFAAAGQNPWQSLGTCVFDQARAFHLGKSPMAAFVTIPSEAPGWFRLIAELKQARRQAGSECFLDPDFTQAMARWQQELARRASRGGVPEEFEPNLEPKARDKAWERTVLQAPVQWLARFRQWTTESMALGHNLPVGRRSKLRA